MNNSDRLDVLTPIVDALKLPNLTYLKDTQVYGIGDVDFAVFSIFDNKDNWPKADTLFGNKKIALFHGPVDNSTTDVGYVVSSRHFTTEIFDGYDLALLGDIHKRQEMVSPSGCKVVYAGSLVQQNFGETLDKHGFLVWDLDTMTYEEVDIQNDYGYYTMDIVNGVVPDVINLPKFPRLRVRFSETDAADTKRAITEIKIKYGVEDFTIIKTDSLAKKKTGDRDNQIELEDITNVNYQNSLITDYIQRMMPFVTPEDVLGIQSLNKEINSKIVIDDLTRNVQWKPLRFEFSNMFSYGEDNIINFDKVSGLMGLFAPNASGKSSLFDAISFCLFDRCSRTFKASNILNNRKSDFHCQLDFNVEGIPYYIRREARMVNNGRNVKVDVQFWRVKDGISESLNGTERRDTNSVIEQYVGRYEDFVLTALSLQGNNTLFIDKSQSERKEDIKEVSALIRNFKRTDFTTELATKETDLKESKKIVNELEITLKDLNKKKEGIQNQISDLKESLTPIDSRLELSTLEAAKGSIESKLVTNRKDREDKEVKINEYQTLLNEVSQSINQHSEINGLSIDDAKKEWDLAKGKIADVQQQIDRLESQYESNLDKLKHLEQHEYDPNCQYCMNNVFVKDAIATKEVVKTQESQLETLNIGHHALIKATEPFSDVEDVWGSLVELRNKYQKGEIIIQKTQAEWDGLGTQYELLITQLSGIKADINRYNAISETILQNKEINERIKTLEIQKKEFDKDISDTNKKILQKTGEIGSIDSFINTTKAKISEVKDLENKNTLYTYYLDAVKKDGVPYELISKAMPVIENEVNNILAQVVDFSLSMDTDGKNINAKLVYEDQEWTLEMGSGMEKFISGLAIRVALINICGLPRPNFLVIDEGFGTLDADNLSSLFMMMQYLKTQFDFIWVISHLEQMRDIVDGLIEIKKIDGFSKINF
jgi:DNA repair exonuclease SbcCD ATPase subunit